MAHPGHNPAATSEMKALAGAGVDADDGWRRGRRPDPPPRVANKQPSSVQGIHRRTIVSRVQKSPSSFAVRRAWRRLAASMVAVAWAALGYGLIFSPHNQQAWGDLEAGGRFAANFAVYLPYHALTLPIAVVVLRGLLGRQDLLYPLIATTVAIALFALWVAAQGYLFDAQPQLLASLAGCLIAEAVAVGALAGVWRKAEPARSGAFHADLDQRSAECHAGPDTDLSPRR
ncbi:hypothetical protein ACTMS0_17455 [Micromonospora sp. H33]|uniref:hypothetical protein n=1 Tax=Micromonospora sp. H33 TaxID=3452215 RepID=UPI003F8954CD